MKDIWTYLKETTRPILIYGMGDGCDKILAVCEKKNIPISGIFASDEYVRGQEACGFRVTTYKEAKESFPDMIALLAFGVFREDLMKKICKIAEETELLAPDVPLFGDNLFDLAFYKEHEEEIKKAEEMMADEKSKTIFKNIISFKLTGKIQYLLESESTKEEDLKELLPYKSGDIYADLGAYDGDTVLEWDSLFPDHGEIIAFEPNPKTYLKLVNNTQNVRGVTCLAYAAWNKEEILTFNGKSGRSAAVAENGKIQVEARALDQVCKKCDFIKFDVEGAEKEAIEGTRNLILKNKPSLCISAYHRSEDIFKIPLQVKAIEPSYKVYLRHSPYIPAWDTQYYFIGR